VSNCWGLRKGYTTGTLHEIAHRINKDDLKHGDILLYAADHVVFFAGWQSSAKTHYTCYQEVWSLEVESVLGWLVGWLVGWFGLVWFGLFCFVGLFGLFVLLWLVGLVWFGWVDLVWVGLVWFGLVWFVLFCWFVWIVCFALVCFGLVWFGLVWLVGLVWFGFDFL
jgi:hypothetical protein